MSLLSLFKKSKSKEVGIKSESNSTISTVSLRMPNYTFIFDEDKIIDIIDPNGKALINDLEYEKIWNELKNHLEELVEYHKDGKYESVAKSIHCEIQCREILKRMNNLEISEKIYNSRYTDINQLMRDYNNLDKSLRDVHKLAKSYPDYVFKLTDVGSDNEIESVYVFKKDELEESTK